MALDLAVQLQHQRGQGPVIPSRAQRTRQLRRLFIAVFDVLIERLHGPLQRPLPQQLCLSLVQYTEVRRQTPPVHRLQQVDVLPQQ